MGHCDSEAFEQIHARTHIRIDSLALGVGKGERYLAERDMGRTLHRQLLKDQTQNILLSSQGKQRTRCIASTEKDLSENWTVPKVDRRRPYHESKWMMSSTRPGFHLVLKADYVRFWLTHGI